MLSSEAHKQSALMSSRLFGGVAAGAVIICDENLFAKTHFGDSLLYIDASLPPDEVLESITRHVQWIKSNPEKAPALSQKAQDIFRAKFRLDLSLTAIAEVPLLRNASSTMSPRADTSMIASATSATGFGVAC